MKTGIMLGATPLPDDSLGGLTEYAKQMEARGFDSLWMANIFGLDAIMTLALVGQATTRVEVGTAVVPTFPRHPAAMAQQAVTAGVATGGRFTLGIGLSHQIVIESMFGLSYARPARHMREYLEVLGPMMRGEAVSHQGEVYRVNAGLQLSDIPEVPLLVAALGPRMLAVAGELSDGTVTWMTGPKTLESHIAPGIRKAAEQAGRPEPRIVAGFPVAVCDDVDASREKIGQMLAMYGTLPSYRAMLDREGLGGPGDLAIVGDEKAVEAELDRLAGTGTTDFVAAIAPVADDTAARTTELLASRL